MDSARSTRRCADDRRHVGEQSIDAVVVAAAAGVAAGSSGVGVAVSAAGSYAENKITTDDQGLHRRRRQQRRHRRHHAPAACRWCADDASGIDAIAGAASLAAGFGSSAGIGVAIGLSLAFNEIDNDVDASIQNADEGVKTTAGSAITISALSQGNERFRPDRHRWLHRWRKLDDAASPTPTTRTIRTNQPVNIVDTPDDPATPDINEQTLKSTPLRVATMSPSAATTSSASVLPRSTPTSDQGDRLVLAALRTAFEAQGEALAMYDIVATASKFKTCDGVQDVREGTTVRWTRAMPPLGGTAGRVYRYIVMAPETAPTSSTTSTCRSEDYTDDSKLAASSTSSSCRAGRGPELDRWSRPTAGLTCWNGLARRRHRTSCVSRQHDQRRLGGGLAGRGRRAGRRGRGHRRRRRGGAERHPDETNAYADHSVIDSAADVTLNAASTSKIYSTVVAASLAIGRRHLGRRRCLHRHRPSRATSSAGGPAAPTSTPLQVEVQATSHDTSVRADGDLR